MKCLQKKDYKIVIASGPAGTGKTLFGIEQGVKNYMSENFEKLQNHGAVRIERFVFGSKLLLLQIVQGIII